MKTVAYALTVLLRLKSSHIKKVEINVKKAKGRYHHQAGLLLRTLMFMPNKLFWSQIIHLLIKRCDVPLQTKEEEK